MYKKYLFANWKMYLGLDGSVKLAQDYVDKLNLGDDVEMVIFPTSLSFSIVKELLKDSKIDIGYQNAYSVPEGGYTGEVSVKMYKDAGSKYALIGHSERRHVFGETNECVKNKMKEVLKNDLVPVLCVGETSDERLTKKTELVLKEQIDSALKETDLEDRDLFIAYEPVWAIGTGDACSSVFAEEIAFKIKTWVSELQINVKPVILYGGSVNAENVVEYLKEANVDGVLVGGSSANFDKWENIVKKAK